MKNIELGAVCKIKDFIEPHRLCEVIKVGNDAKRITVKAVKANRNGTHTETVFSLRKNGRYVEVGCDQHEGAGLYFEQEELTAVLSAYKGHFIPNFTRDEIEVGSECVMSWNGHTVSCRITNIRDLNTTCGGATHITVLTDHTQYYFRLYKDGSCVAMDSEGFKPRLELRKEVKI